jgi:hypothetical protein
MSWANPLMRVSLMSMVTIYISVETMTLVHR